MNCPELPYLHRKHYEIALWYSDSGLYPWWGISGSNRRPSRCKIGTPWPQNMAKTLFQYVMNVFTPEEVKKNGGEYRSRTDDLLRARQAL